MADEKTSASTDVRNVYQRKQAVVRRCAAIVPDKKHPAHHYMYNSIQNVSNHLRAIGAEEGLDIQPSFNHELPGWLFLTFTNVDKPSEQIVSEWPVVDGDKGFAYTTKFPLIRSFLIGDGEENDESEMADRSGQQTRTPPAPPARQPAARRPAQAQPPPSNGELDPDEKVCPKCGKPGSLKQKANGAWYHRSGEGGCGKEFEQPVTRAEFHGLEREAGVETPATADEADAPWLGLEAR
jgi:hypothetical protein